MSTKSEKIQPQSRGMELVFNRGQKELTAAVVPIQWFFTPEVVDEKPTHLLILVQNEDQIENGFSNQVGERQRHLIEIGASMVFLTLSEPGIYRLTVIAFNQEAMQTDGYTGTEDFIRNSHDRYMKEFHVEDVEEWIVYGKVERKEDSNSNAWEWSRAICAAEIVNIEIPRALFVERPQGKFANAVWSWVNRWFGDQPVDQCRYRARFIFAFLLQPPLFVIGHTLKYVFSLISTLVLIGGRLLMPIIGFKPVPIFGDIGEHWAWKPGKVIGADFDYREHRTYRLWNTRKMPFTPLEALVFGGLSWLAYNTFRYHPEEIRHMAKLLLNWFMLLLPVLILGFRFVIFPLLSRWDRLQSTRPRRSSESEYADWLRRNVVIGTSTNQTESYRHKLAHLVKVRFMAVKVKVCRPYSGRYK